jgi:hypothetical protein
VSVAATCWTGRPRPGTLLATSFDRVVLAAQPDGTDAKVRAMADLCQGLHYPEGKLDERIVVLYESLRTGYPDHLPLSDDSPWTDTPLSGGIDHVIMAALLDELRAPNT